MKHTIFRLVERYLGLHILPVHYYSPVPVVGEIEPSTYLNLNPLHGLQMNDDLQLMLFKDSQRYLAEFKPSKNTGLSMIDSLILYAIQRCIKPFKVVEVGSGESTHIALEALTKNRQDGHPFKFVAIEPYPNQSIVNINDIDFTLITSFVQDVPLDALSDADILFIDSSHVSKIGSDVNHEIFKLLPLLKVGAYIHWHDIMIPGEYPRAWLQKGTFWNESYLVNAFMMYNESYEIIWAGRYMQHTYADQLCNSDLGFNANDADQHLSSFWIRRIK